jgi:hypothetical protein
MDNFWSEAEQVLKHMGMWTVGAAIGVGQLLYGDDPLCWRRIVGRALVSGGLATAAGALLVFWADTPGLGMFGVAAALASLGASSIERKLDMWMQSRYPHHRRIDDDREGEPK